jgi:hypothetical protein
VNEDDFFKANPQRRYRLVEIERIGQRRIMAIIDRKGREHRFVAGPTFCPLETDSVLATLINGMTVRAS